MWNGIKVVIPAGLSIFEMIILVSVSLSEKPSGCREASSCLRPFLEYNYHFEKQERHLYSTHVDRFLSQGRLWCQYIYFFPRGILTKVYAGRLRSESKPLGYYSPF